MPPRFAMIAAALALSARAALGQTVFPPLPKVYFDAPGGVDTIVFQRTVTRSGVDSASGTRTVVMRVIWTAVSHGELEVSQGELEVVQRFPGGGGEIVDTALANPRTLQAIAHRSHQPARTMRFAFVGAQASGSVRYKVASGDSTVPVEQAIGGPIFDSNIIELVVASLPLREDYGADVPFFIYERGGRVVMPVAVKQRTSVEFPRLGTRDVWVVTVGVPGAPATLWVDAATRAVLRVRYDITSRSLSFTDDRVTPLRS
jgi:hypothetical protein